MKLTRAQLKNNILQSIRADIISHRLKPGQSIQEDQLAKHYGISRTPIREILRKLEQEDLVKIVPNVGAFVSDLTSKDIEEVLDIRLWLETAAAKAAALKATEEQLAEFTRVDKQLDLAVEKQDSIISFEADDRLHDLILVAADNERARKIIKNLIGQVYRIRFISGHKPGRINTTVAEHKQIVAAILAREPERAEEAMRIHILNTKKILLSSSSDMEAKFEALLRNSPIL
jgi:DNA-binding GntR family transcriptional regulator